MTTLSIDLWIDAGTHATNAANGIALHTRHADLHLVVPAAMGNEDAAAILSQLEAVLRARRELLLSGHRAPAQQGAVRP